MIPTFGEIEPLGPWTDHIQAMNQALTERDPGDSFRAWRQAYSAALSHPGWLGLLVVAMASLRLATFPGLARNADERAREAYWLAFFRARQQRSLDGVLHAAEAFAELGDRTTAEQCLRVAEVLATTRGGDSPDAERVRLSAARLRARSKEEERASSA
jgi:hypothetical protein